MNKLQRGAAVALATASLLLNTGLPVFAGTTILITGNGSDTTNTADVDVNQTTYVDQSNQANVSNYVKAEAETGENTASRNTGGSVTIDTGDAKTEVGVSNMVNSNVADVACCEGDVDVEISGNGDNSTNTVELEIPDEEVKAGTAVYQANIAKIDNYVEAEAETGENDAKRNTGGDVEILTGKAKTTVSIVNQANSNSATVSGNSDGASISARILDNGSDTTNTIDLDYNRTLFLDQFNYARVDNYVEAEAETGENTASRNTGGTVLIDTGDAETNVLVDNLVNFNWADVDCGCILDLTAKIAGNGDNSNNLIDAEIEDELAVYQTNTCKKSWWGSEWFDRWGWWKKPCLDNYVEADSETGENTASRNTGESGVDPAVFTGDAMTDVLIENAGNSNVFGEGAPEWDWELPLPGFSFNLNLSFSLSDLLALLS